MSAMNAPMHSRNAKKCARNLDNLAMSIGHLYTSFARFRISNMFLSTVQVS
jgi:hypothetical protein